MFVVILFFISCACQLYLEKTKGIFCKIWMLTLKWFYYISMFFVLYRGIKGEKIRLADESIGFMLLIIGVIGFLFTKGYLFTLIEKLLLGELNGRSIFDEFGLIKHESFLEVKACLIVTGITVFLLLYYLVR